MPADSSGETTLPTQSEVTVPAPATVHVTTETPRTSQKRNQSDSESTYQNLADQTRAHGVRIDRNEDGTTRVPKQKLEDLVRQEDVDRLLKANPALSTDDAHRQILASVAGDTADRMLIRNAQGVFDPRGPEFEKVRAVARLLDKDSYKAVFEALTEKIRNGVYSGSDRKVQQKWMQFVQGGDHMVAYDVVNLDPSKIDTGVKVDFVKVATSLPGKIWEYAKQAPKSLLANIKHAVTHPHYIKDAVKAFVQNWDVRKWKDRSWTWKMGAVVGALESAYVAWMAPLPGSGNVKAAVNFALINGGMLGADILSGRKAAKLGRQFSEQSITQGEFEERLFKVRSQKSKAEGFLREFGRGLSVGSGLAALDATLLKGVTNFSFTEIGAKAAERTLQNQGIAVPRLNLPGFFGENQIKQPDSTFGPMPISYEGWSQPKFELMSTGPHEALLPLAENLNEVVTAQEDIKMSLREYGGQSARLAVGQLYTNGEIPEGIKSLYQDEVRESFRRALNVTLLDLEKKNPKLFTTLNGIPKEDWGKLLTDLQKQNLFGKHVAKFMPFRSEMGNLIPDVQKNFAQLYAETVNSEEFVAKVRAQLPTVPAAAAEAQSAAPSPPVVETPPPAQAAATPVSETISATTVSDSHERGLPRVGVQTETVSAPTNTAADVTAGRLERVGQKAVATLLSQEEVRAVLNNSIEGHAAGVTNFARSLATEQGYDLPVLPPEQAEQFMSQAREAMRNMAGESFNKALDETLEAATVTVQNPEFVKELQDLKDKNPEGFALRVGELLQKAQTESTSPEAQFLRNVNSASDRLLNEAINDAKLRGNLADFIEQGKEEAKGLVDRYVRQREPLPPLDAAVSEIAQRGGERVYANVAPVAEKVITELANDPDSQALVNEFLNGKVGDNVDTAGILVNRALEPYGLKLQDVTPENLKTLINEVKIQTAPIQNAAFETALDDLATLADQKNFDAIRAMDGNELVRQINVLATNPEALENPTQFGVEPSVAEFAKRTQTLYTTALSDPLISSYLADRLDQQTEWLSQLSNTVRGTVEAQAPIGQVETLNQAADRVTEAAARVAQKTVDVVISQPEVQTFLTNSVGQHADAANEILLRSGVQVDEAALNQAREQMRVLAGENFNKALDEALADATTTAQNPDFARQMTTLRDSNPTEFAQRVSDMVTNAQVNPDSPEAAFFNNVNIHFQKLYNEALADAKLRNNVADFNDVAIDTTKAAVDRFVRQGEPLPPLDAAFAQTAQNLGTEVVTQVAPVADRIIAEMAQDQDLQALRGEFLNNNMGKNIDITGVLVNRVLDQYNWELKDLSADGVKRVIAEIKTQVAPLENKSFELALDQLAENTTQEQFDTIRAMKTEDFARQMETVMQNPDAMENPTAYNVSKAVAELAKRAQNVYVTGMSDPVIRTYLAKELDNGLDWLKYFNTAVRVPEAPFSTEPLSTGFEVAAPEIPITPVSQQILENIESIKGKEIIIKPGDTVGGIIASETDLPVRWSSQEAPAFGAHLAANYKLLENMWDRVESVGLKPERVSPEEIKDLIVAAQKGDAGANDELRRMWDSLRFIPAGSTFVALNNEQVSTMMEKLGVTTPSLAKAA